MTSFPLYLLLTCLLTFSFSQDNEGEYCQYTFNDGTSFNITGAYQESGDYCVLASPSLYYCMNPCHNSLTCQNQGIEAPFCIVQNGQYSGCGDLTNVTVAQYDDGGYVQKFGSELCGLNAVYPTAITSTTSGISSILESTGDYHIFTVRFHSPYNSPVHPSLNNPDQVVGIISVQDFSNLDLTLNDWSLKLAETLGISNEYFLVYGSELYTLAPVLKEGFNSYFLSSPSQSASSLWGELQSLIEQNDPTITQTLGIYAAQTTDDGGDGDDSDDDGSDDTLLIVLCVVIPVVTIGLLAAAFVLYRRRQSATVPVRDYALYQGL